MSLLAELKRRNVFKVGGAYLVLAWIMIQITDAAVPALRLPEWVNSLVFLLGILGFPFALFFAWAFELTPDGIKKESEISGEHSIAEQTGKKLNYFTVIALIFALGFILYQRFFMNPGNDNISPTQQKTVSKDSRISIAVLPFINMSNDASQEYFSDGMTEEILNVLAKNKKLLVAARTSAFAFKGKNEDIRTIGKTLGVSNILEGSVRRAGDDLRITAQLIRVQDGFHLWSETYDRKMEKVFALQEEIAKDISKALQAPLGIEVKHLVDNKTTNMAAYDLYLRGRQLIRQRGKSIGEAANLMTLAIEKDDQYAPAWALRSLALMYIPNYLNSYNGQPINPDKLIMQAGESARKAVRLDPNLAIAHYALANFYRQHLQWAMAEDEYLLAYKLDPVNIDLIEDYAEFLQIVGRLNEANQIAKRGLELEPKTPVAILNYLDQLLINYITYDQSEIESLIKKVEQLQPNSSWLIYEVVYYYIAQKQYQKAFDYNDSCVECKGAYGYGSTQYYLNNLIMGTQPDFAKFSLTETTNPYLYYVFGGIKGVLGALERLDSYDSLAYIQAPFMSEVRKTKRYKTLVTFLGLADYWRHRTWPDYCHPISDTDFECE